MPISIALTDWTNDGVTMLTMLNFLQMLMRHHWTEYHLYERTEDIVLQK